MVELGLKLKSQKFNKMERNFRLDTPIGKLEIECSDKGVKKIKFLSEKNENLDKNGDSCNDNDHITSAVQWLEVYFKDPSKTKTMEFPQLDLEEHSKKEFMCKVWQVLKERVGPGETVSYGELAKLCESPKAARAVGQAMRNNPFTILVPCHRVINGKGELGNYSSGVEKKKWLLNHEGLNF